MCMRVGLLYEVQEVRVPKFVPVLSVAKRKTRWLHENTKLFTGPFREQTGKIHSIDERLLRQINSAISQHNSE